jgi:hypothetical protein
MNHNNSNTMKFKAYKHEAASKGGILSVGKIIPESVITDADPVRLVLYMTDRTGHITWKIVSSVNGTPLASSDQGYAIEISSE